MNTQLETDKPLQEIWKELAGKGYETDKFSVHSYGPVYEELFKPYRDSAKNVLEIGLFNGHSMRLWHEYFTEADVNGIDCDERPHGGLADLRPLIQGGWPIWIMDACDTEKAVQYFGNMRFDIIIEDSGHNIEQQLELYSIYKQFLAPGSLYIVEDVQAIDETRHLFENLDLDKNIEIIDRRHVKGRYDDVLIIITDK